MRNYWIPLLFVASVAIVSASPFSEAFTPVQKTDQAATKPDFAQYRAGLEKVIQNRDAEGLKAYLSPQIHYSFGLEKPGIPGFYAVWKPTSKNSQLWKELGQVVRNGGSFAKNGEFTAPSWYANWPQGKDESEWGVISDAAVPVFFEPKSTSKTLPDIGNCWVQINQNEANQRDRNFTCIDLPKSMQNPYKVESVFVKSEQVHRLLDYRAVFAKNKGRWQMVSFVAGD